MCKNAYFVKNKQLFFHYNVDKLLNKQLPLYFFYQINFSHIKKMHYIAK